MTTATPTPQAPTPHAERETGLGARRVCVRS